MCLSFAFYTCRKKQTRAYHLGVFAHAFVTNLSRISHLNAKIIISTVETEQHAFPRTTIHINFVTVMLRVILIMKIVICIFTEPLHLPTCISGMKTASF